jgi:hypothetical protein
MILPRYADDECSCNVVEVRVTNENAAAPVTTRAMHALTMFGAAAVAARQTPKAADVATR